MRTNMHSITGFVAVAASLLAACGEVPPPPQAGDGGPTGDGREADAAPDGPPPVPVEPPCGQWSELDAVLAATWTQQGAFNPAITGDKLTLYVSARVAQEIVMRFTRPSTTADWTGDTATFGGQDGGYRVTDVSKDGRELILIKSDDASSFYAALRTGNDTTVFGAPVRLGVGGLSASISLDRLSLFIAEAGQIKQSTRATTGGTWGPPATVLTWTGPSYSAVDVSDDGHTLLLSGADGAAISRWNGSAWTPPVAVPMLDRTFGEAEIVQDDIYYVTYQNNTFATRCVEP